MKLSDKQKKILNELVDYLPALRKDQIGKADGGNLKLGDAFEDKSEKPVAVDAIADPSTATAEDVANKLNELLAALQA